MGELAMPLDANQTLLNSKYHIRILIGVGGTGSVWLAQNLQSVGRMVAIKVVEGIGAGKSQAHCSTPRHQHGHGRNPDFDARGSASSRDPVGPRARLPNRRKDRYRGKSTPFSNISSTLAAVAGERDQLELGSGARPGEQARWYELVLKVLRQTDLQARYDKTAQMFRSRGTRQTQCTERMGDYSNSGLVSLMTTLIPKQVEDQFTHGAFFRSLGKEKKFSFPTFDIKSFAQIKVVGSGDGGSNAVNRMFEDCIHGVELYQAEAALGVPVREVIGWFPHGVGGATYQVPAKCMRASASCSPCIGSFKVSTEVMDRVVSVDGGKRRLSAATGSVACQQPDPKLAAGWNCVNRS
jgi:hypothetical protein